MSKAEERAQTAYPTWRNGIDDKFNSGSAYCGFIKGYEQAEKDLELTWKDIKIILDAENDILRECNSRKELVIEIYPKEEDYYGEVLKRFKDYKERKEQ